MEPMLLVPAGKDYLWGGTRLRTEYEKAIPLTPLAETWECSIHPDGPSTVKSGNYAGQKLTDVLKKHPDFLGKRVSGELPVLVKLIDAAQDLSIQVHPNDEFAREHENDNGKTEMWYVLDAEPGATLIHGFAHSVTKDLLREAVRSGTLSKHLQYVPVKKGDVFFIPPGTIHAIGAGVLLAEVQESSNVTYRVYDYNRRDKDGKLRPLHFEKAVQVLNMQPEGDVRQKHRLTHYYPGCSREILGRCEFFELEKIQVTKGFSFTVSENSFQILLCIEGDGGLETPSLRRPLRFKKGDCLFLPAGLDRCYILGATTLLKIRY